MAITMNPYLTFPAGSCRAAFEFYASVFGGEPQFLPLAGMPNMPDDDSLVMHAHLHTDEVTLMGADNVGGGELLPGNAFEVALMGAQADLDRGRELFDRLAEGGSVDMAFEPQMWGGVYGQVTDRFGVHWAINIDQPPADGPAA